MRFFTCLYFSNMAIILIEHFFTPGDKMMMIMMEMMMLMMMMMGSLALTSPVLCTE